MSFTKNAKHFLFGAAALAGLSLAGAPALADSVQLEPAKDNTLFEDGGGAFSNGAGDHVFAGVTNGVEIRRALLQFDIAGAIPAGATITSVDLTLNMSRNNGNPLPTTLHRVSADWGEGISDAPGNEGMGTASENGDATWVHTFFDTDTWASLGGDFDAAPSASQTVPDTLGPVTWASTPELVADVQGWLDDPSGNFGWILVGDEAAAGDAKRFDSRDNATPANRPLLTVNFDLPTAVENWNAYE